MKNSNFVPMYRNKNYYVSLRKVIGGVRNRPEHSIHGVDGAFSDIVSENCWAVRGILIILIPSQRNKITYFS